jgi:thymidine phosphorylase
LVPADGVIYGLRDQTGTVDSIPLIASSVMSKKIAAGADGIVLDVKCGRGAFMKTILDARELARQMVDIGRTAGKQTRALITSMDQPLGLAVGNALEVAEAIATLRGHGPEDLEEEVLALGAEILIMAGTCPDAGAAHALLRSKLSGGEAAEKFREMIEWQSGRSEVVDDVSLLPKAERVVPVTCRARGYLQEIDALQIGAAAMDLGAGRRTKDEPVAAAAGVVLRRKPGGESGFVEPDAVLAELHVPPDWDARVPLDTVIERVRAAFSIGPEPPAAHQAVLDAVS